MRAAAVLLPFVLLALLWDVPAAEAPALTDAQKAELAAWEAAQRKIHDEAVAKALAEYKQAMRSAKTPNERATAVWQLGEAERDTKILAELARSAREPALVRQEAVNALAEYRGQKAASQAILTALAASRAARDEAMVERCLTALAGAAHASCVPTVVRLVADDDKKVAAGAIRVLGEAGAPAAIGPLLAVWDELERDKERSGNTKKQAEERLKVVGDPLKEALAKLTGETLTGPAEYRQWWLKNRSSLAKRKPKPSPPVCSHLAPATWVSPEGLVGYWPFDDGKGSPSAADCSGNGFHAAYAGGPSSATQVPPALAFSSHGLRFDGSGAHVVVKDAPALRIEGDLTIAFWMRKDGDAPDYVRLVGKGDQRIRTYGVFLEKGSGGRLMFQQHDGNGKGIVQFSGKTDIRTGAWYHVAAVVDGDRATLYVNGAKDGSKDRNGTAGTSKTPLTIGHAGYHKPFNGLIDDVRVYARPLARAEIRMLVRGLRAAPAAMASIPARPPGPPPDLVPIPADLAGLVADTKPVRYAWDLLRMGTKPYVDRDYPLSAVASCNGLPFLRTACDDKKRKVEETVVSFELKREATVLVAMDNRVPKPSWLSGYKDSGEDIAVRHRNGTFTYRLWARDHPPGRVTLGGIASNDAMYVVILRPKGGVALDAGTTSAPAGLEPQEGTFHRAVNLNGPELTVDGNRWESGLRAENCLAYGQAVDDRVTTPAPEVDAVFARVLQSGFRGANQVRILLGGIERGTYRVYLYVRDGQAKFGVRLEGKQVERGLTCGAGGAWKRIGPMEAEVTDGALEVKMAGRAVSVCGIELWKK